MAGKSERAKKARTEKAGTGAKPRTRTAAKGELIDTRRGALKFGSRYCICSACGLRVDHERGVPCSSQKCPRCGGFMRGEHCA